MLLLVHFTNDTIEGQKSKQLVQGHRVGKEGRREVNLESLALELYL